jgi:hypothetical protein
VRAARAPSRALAGTVRYRASGVNPRANSFGTLRGDLRARFDSIGRVRPFATGPLEASLLTRSPGPVS